MTVDALEQDPLPVQVKAVPFPDLKSAETEPFSNRVDGLPLSFKGKGHPVQVGFRRSRCEHGPGVRSVRPCHSPRDELFKGFHDGVSLHIIDLCRDGEPVVKGFAGKHFRTETTVGLCVQGYPADIMWRKGSQEYRTENAAEIPVVPLRSARLTLAFSDSLLTVTSRRFFSPNRTRLEIS